MKTIDVGENIQAVMDYLKKLYPSKDIPYGIQFRLNCGVINVYFSGKLVYQGSENCEKVIDEILNHIPQQNIKTPSIGCDEAGKGEFLGPLVVSCVWIKDIECYRRLQRKGFFDSKKMSKNQMLELYSWLRYIGKGSESIKFSYMIVPPDEFDRLYSHMGNLTRLLDYLYIRALLKLPLSDNIIIDKYSPKPLVPEFIRGVELKEKAEALFHVAAASVVAKVLYEKWIEENVPLKIRDILSKGHLSIEERRNMVYEEDISRWVKNVYKGSTMDNR